MAEPPWGGSARPAGWREAPTRGGALTTPRCPCLAPWHARPLRITVAQLCRTFKERVIAAGCPRLGVMPLLSAVQRLRPTPEHLTPMHADVLQL